MSRAAAVLLVLTLCATGCAQSLQAHSRAFRNEPSEIQLASHTKTPEKLPVYIMSNGFHTGIIVRAADVPRDVWPEVDAIPGHPWIEVGWGSEIFYRAKKITVPVVFGAFVPNPSVLHVVGRDLTPEETFHSAGDLIRLELDPEQYTNLCRHIHDTYEHDADGEPINLGPGIYADGSFFRARGNYYFPKTCNVWTARGLQQARIPIVPEMCGVADAVLHAADRSGTTIRRR
jgi:uncharacterized protein (TIGR02117 family)